MYARLRADNLLPGDTVALLLAQRSIFPNAVHPLGSGTTALHLAASLPRLDVVNLLLEQDGIDDTLRDAQGRTCLEVAKGKEVQRAIKGVHDSFRVLYSQTHWGQILETFSTPRIARYYERTLSRRITSGRRKHSRSSCHPHGYARSTCLIWTTRQDGLCYMKQRGEKI